MVRLPRALVSRSASIAIFAVLSTLVGPKAFAGSGANVVLYDHHLGEKGETEIEAYADYGRNSDGERYAAQLYEIKHAVTDQWTTSFYLETHKINGEPWEFDGFRFENRYRLFKETTLFNPVLYLEYINKRKDAQFVREAVGRTDEEEEGEEGEGSERENELETKLILGHDFGENLRVGFNWINEVNLKSGVWKFGYATGFTYKLFEREGLSGLTVKEMALGFEAFGGLGDSEKGLTFDGSKTEQYIGVNLKTEFANHVEFLIGGAFGLTADSQDAILRTQLSYEFE